MANAKRSRSQPLAGLHQVRNFAYFKFLRRDGRPWRTAGAQMRIPCLCHAPFFIYSCGEKREIRPDISHVLLLGFSQDRAVIDYCGAYPTVPIEAIEVTDWNRIDPAARAVFEQAQARARSKN